MALQMIIRRLPDEYTDKMLADPKERHERDEPDPDGVAYWEKYYAESPPALRLNRRAISLKIIECLRVMLGSSFKVDGPKEGRGFGARATTMEFWKFIDTTTAQDGGHGTIAHELYVIEQKHEPVGDPDEVPFDPNLVLKFYFNIKVIAPPEQLEERYERFKQMIDKCISDKKPFKTELGRKVSVRTSGKVVPMLERAIPQLPSDVLRAKVAKFVGGPTKVAGRKRRTTKRRKRTLRRRY